MTAPAGAVYPIVQTLPSIPVTCYAGQRLEFAVPILTALGSGADVAQFVGAAAQVRTTWESDYVWHRWSTDEDGMALEGTPGGTDGAVRLVATGSETALWQQQWPKLTMQWDVEIIDTTGEPHRLCAASPFILLAEITHD